MNAERVLITADPLEAQLTIEALKNEGKEILHLPLEWIKTNSGITREDLIQEIKCNDIIVFGSYRNTHHFLDLIKHFELLEIIRQRLNFTIDAASADLLESNGVPGITSHPHTKAIHLLELILRLGQLRPALYPRAKNALEEMPALFEELDVPCKTLSVCKREHPNNDQLQSYRKELESIGPDTVFIHDNDMVRYLTIAFPGLDLKILKVIAANQAVEAELQKESIPFETVENVGLPIENFWAR